MVTETLGPASSLALIIIWLHLQRGDYCLQRELASTVFPRDFPSKCSLCRSIPTLMPGISLVLNSNFIAFYHTWKQIALRLHVSTASQTALPDQASQESATAC